MNRSYLMRKASIIHAIKCNKTSNPSIAEASLVKLGQINSSLKEVTEDQLPEISQQIEDWANKAPVASPMDINELLIKKYE